MRLPPLMLRMPRIIYGIALLFAVWSFALSYFEMAAIGRIDPENSAVRLTMLRGLFQATLEGTYIALYGVLAHLLLAIWHNGSTGTPSGGEP